MPVAVPLDTAKPTAEVARPWGFWATMGWSALTMLVILLIQMVLAVPFVVVAMAREPDLDLEAFSRQLESNGLLLSVSTLLTVPACVGLLALAIRIRRQPVRDYLALHRPGLGECFKWTAGLAVFIVCSDTLTWLVGRSVVPPFLTDAYHSAGFVPLLFFALIILAPIWEETMFRGFMFRGIASSPLGAAGAIILPAAAWAVIHVQYDAYDVGTIFVLGLFLGLARHRTGSTLLTIILHALANVVATAELLVVLAIASRA